MSKYLKWLVGLGLIAAIATISYALFAPASTGPGQTARQPGTKGGGGRGKRAPADAVPVFAALARSVDIPVTIEGLGTARALNTVTVQPLVDGRIVSINFREGQDVRQGDLLARIDPAIYEAQLKQAQARKAQDEAQLADARRELDRNSRLGPIATLQKNLDTSRAKVAQLEALVKADQAAVDLAETQLNYTSVVAPISGRTGLRLVDEGNVVRASAAGGIVVITQVQPIAVLFNLPQQQLGRINAAIAAAGAGKGIPVEAVSPDGKTIVDRGELKVVDNQVDQTTGTVRLKAEFPNATLQLWPGQFISIRLLVDTLRNVVAVPAAAIQQGPNGPFVFVAGTDDRAVIRTVRIALQDERQAAIAGGLQTGERVITSSFSRLRDDTAVTLTLVEDNGAPSAGTSSTPAASDPAAQPRQDGTRGPGSKGKRREGGGEKGTPSQ